MNKFWLKSKTVSWSCSNTGKCTLISQHLPFDLMVTSTSSYKRHILKQYVEQFIDHLLSKFTRITVISFSFFFYIYILLVLQSDCASLVWTPLLLINVGVRLDIFFIYIPEFVCNDDSMKTCWIPTKEHALFSYFQ